MISGTFASSFPVAAGRHAEYGMAEQGL